MNVFHPSIRIDKSGGDGGRRQFWSVIYIDGENNVENIFVYKESEREKRDIVSENAVRNGTDI